MILDELRRMLAGRVEISIEGDGVEKFVNMATQNGIDLRNIRKKRGGYWAEITPADFKRIRALTRRAGVKVRPWKKGGFPFLCARLVRRPVLLGGLLLFVASLYYLLGFVWFIEIRGLEQLSSAEILGQLGQEGLKVGGRKAGIDVERLEKSLVEKDPRISWAGIDIRGTKAIVEIVERKIPPAEPGTPGDVVAGSDGIVTRLIVLSGTPAVKEGDIVQKGQPIILGVDPKGNKTRAKGVVEARTWREVYLEVPTLIVERKRTGRIFSQTVVRYFGRETIISGRDRIPFQKYELDESKTGLNPWRNGKGPIELIQRTYHETVESKTFLSEEQARLRALNEAKRRLFSGETPVRVLTERADVVQSTNEFVGVRVTFELKEEIGRFKEEGES